MTSTTTRKLTAAMVLLLFAFNTGGYYFLFSSMELQSARQLVDDINNGQFNSGEFIEVQIPSEHSYPVTEQELDATGEHLSTGQEAYAMQAERLEGVLTRNLPNDPSPSIMVAGISKLLSYFSFTTGQLIITVDRWVTITSPSQVSKEICQPVWSCNTRC